MTSSGLKSLDVDEILAVEQFVSIGIGKVGAGGKKNSSVNDIQVAHESKEIWSWGKWSDWVRSTNLL